MNTITAEEVKQEVEKLVKAPPKQMVVNPKTMFAIACLTSWKKANGPLSETTIRKVTAMADELFVYLSSVAAKAQQADGAFNETKAGEEPITQTESNNV